MDVDYTAARFYWDVFQAAVLAGVSIFVWFRTRNSVTADAISRLQADITALQKDVSKRTHFGHLDEVKKELETTNIRLAEVSARLEATTSLLNRMHDFLLQGKL